MARGAGRSARRVRGDAIAILEARRRPRGGRDLSGAQGVARWLHRFDGMKIGPAGLAFTFVLVAPALASAIVGSGSLTGPSQLRVRGCGSHRTRFSAALTVAADGTWIAQTDDGGRVAGTSTPLGRSGRKLQLSLDAPSTADLAADVAQEVAILCDSDSVIVTSTRANALTLSLNRRLTKVKLVMRFTFEGSAGDRSGRATYRLTGNGPWTAG
jgi:hypothetical protein